MILRFLCQIKQTGFGHNILSLCLPRHYFPVFSVLPVTGPVSVPLQSHLKNRFCLHNFPFYKTPHSGGQGKWLFRCPLGILQFHWLQYKQFHCFPIKLFIKINIKILSFFYNLLFVIYIKENIFFLIMNNICFYFFY